MKQIMELNIEISPSEKAILEIIGKDKWKNLINSNQKTNNICLGCGFETKNNQKLNIHILPFDNSLILDSDENSYKKLRFIKLCDACHLIKHFDYAAQNDLVKLVNSNFNQADLIKLCRYKNEAINAYILGGHGIDKNIFLLKKTPLEYLSEISESNLNFNPKIKLIFTKKFNWSNCR